ncbi:DNA-binding transcriptional regulator, Lrp family [Streptomyces sp. 1222.5]|uniref:Lrp/AsnC family transcriptional regulator n=1 Tax=unclassified Streptomyces TaxID=2593676 RepID=UPI000899A66C|nr:MULTISPECIES: Lrp/AsnC family transcriptional regulator [unclassified Streptomyces]PKW09031.1 DNA-binding Lrp family transcriptional regulator [Streptomyces sp. 5112.2]SEC46503.1 DNA-binding transcriptional regulator, Lrp family [Streptomyces sp. 1222.5]SED43106.1 DNA-binding transcriptional regulator, Lrp family [Streptomyces sp. 2231.1]
MDHIDRALLARLQQDATQSYAALGQAVGLSAGAAHDRVRKLRERGAIRRTAAEVDPAAVGAGVLAYVTVDSTAWLGDSGESFAALPEILEAHVVAGSAAVLLKVRAASTGHLQDVLRRVYAIDGVGATRATVVLDTFFERPVSPTAPPPA